ncbi:MAG: type II toxin-antitoxin system YafQ family toxin [Anaerolineae bacterium]|nr:type II toxin-antitoxin system YafQ family toxin [Anaerolineae bacterium]
MKAIRRTSQFKQDVKRVQRRGKDMAKLKMVLESLVKGKRLSPKYGDHVLVGQYKGTRECHLEPDWLLIYELAEDEIILIRTGSHSDLFR